MARRTFDVIDICEILTHWHAGRSKNEIAGSLGLSRNTVRKYLAAAEAAGMAPGGPAVSQERWAELARAWFPELADTRLRQVTWPAIAGHRDYIVAQLEAGVTVSTIHQRLRDESGLAVSVASLRRYVAANLPEEARRSQVRVLRLVPAEPGQEAQIDYGQLGRWLDPRTGRRHTVNAFAMVLCCSRHMFVRPVIRMDQRAWTECHVAAFGFFGGVPARLVPDNLKTGVDRPDLYDPKINRSYAELAARYSCLIDPARSRKPRDKPQVERPMPYIRDSLWRGREFAAVEKDALAPLPADPFVLAEWSRCKVGPDIHASVARALYSIPWRHIGKTLDVRLTSSMVQFFERGELVKTHVRVTRGKQTDLAGYPPEKIAFHMRTPAWCRKKGAEIGPACETLIAGLLEDNALYRLRAAQGVLHLADKHQPGRLEAACAKAAAAGDPSYRTVKGILAAGTEQAPVTAPSGDGGAPAFLHGPDALFTAGNVVPLRPGTEAAS